MTHTKPILCLDFDGVIHSYTSGWKGIAEIPDPIVPGAIDFIMMAQKFFRVAIYSTRSAFPEGLLAMQRYLKANWPWMNLEDDNKDHPYWAIEWPREKPPALVTLDDRALTFTGIWPDPEYLRAFKPWNKK